MPAVAATKFSGSRAGAFLDGFSLRIISLCAHGDLNSALASLTSSSSSAAPQQQAYAALVRFTSAAAVIAPFIPSLQLSNHLITLYSKCGRFDLARKLFDEMPQKNLVSYTALISAYSQSQRHIYSFNLFNSMISHNYLPNDFSVSSVLSSCAYTTNLSFGCQVHALTIKTYLDANVYVGNALISMYSSCCSVKESWVLFENLREKNVITWNSIINASADEAICLFDQMRGDGIGFDKATLVIVISSSSLLCQSQALHSLVIKTGFASMVEIITALMKAYSSLSGDSRECYMLLQDVREHDIVLWTSIMTMHVDNEPEQTISIFCHLRRDGFVLDRYTFSIAIKASASFATERHSMSLHSLILRYGFGSDTVLLNAMIHAYSRCGNLQLAEEVFEQIRVRDIVSWNSIFKGYAAHGKSKKALEVFSHMDIFPDSATFVGLLSACSHTGLVDEGRDIFRAMTKHYGIQHELDHYACMVDILGRAGKLSEAEAIINDMPMKPDAVIWSSLLSACRKYGETEMGEKATEKLMELDSRSSLGYIVMSNIYCATGSFRDAAYVRKEMKGRGMKKELGLSWVEINNCIHEFSAGGKYHPQREEIYAELNRLVGKVEKIGYVAETRLVLHEIKEEHKEERLLNHSEKLALAFGLLNACPDQPSIKIMKNIRICEDCHNFMKLASKCVSKELVVRDLNRFHHFANGICSCSDYW